jgi:hypothetical protein
MKNYSRAEIGLLLPVRLWESTALFAEGRAGFENTAFDGLQVRDGRVDYGVGGGYRTIWFNGWLFGVNVFWDRAFLDHDWYTSTGFGFESDLALGKNDTLDMSLNLYRGGGADLETGYTFPVLNDHADFRIMAGKYRFYDGEFILGWKAGFDLATPDRTFAIAYEFSQDSRHPACHAVGLQASLAFSLENLFHGKNPFLTPDPTYPGRRDIQSRLSSNVERSWRHPDSVVRARNTPIGNKWTTPGRIRNPLWTRLPRWTYESEDRHRCGNDHEDDFSVFDLLRFPVKVAVVTDALYRRLFGPFKDEPPSGEDTEKR